MLFLFHFILNNQIFRLWQTCIQINIRRHDLFRQKIFEHGVTTTNSNLKETMGQLQSSQRRHCVLRGS